MLRRILWIVPTLFFVSILVFQFLSWTLPKPKGHAEGAASAVFFNSSPDNVRDRALTSMMRVATGEREREAARELAELGGAALPHVLPRLDQLDPDGRARVSIALRPVARRMGLGTREDFGSGEATTLFWARFWQDRALDYRPVVVRRLAKRAGERRLTLRRDDIIQLDTYALPELMRALGRVWDRDDIARVRRLTELLGHVTQKPDWVVPEGATVAEANQMAQKWHGWWNDNRDRFTTLDGLSRATAMVTQTTYGKWVRGLSFGLGASASGGTVLDGLKAGAPISLLLVLAGLLGAYPLGAVLGSLGAVITRRARRAATLAALVLGATPVALYATLWGVDEGHSSTFATVLAAVLMAVSGACLSTLHQLAGTRSKLSGFSAQGTRLEPKTWELMRGTGGSSLALFTSDLPLFFMAATVLERGFGLQGVGDGTVEALRSGDVAWLMAIALIGAFAIGLAQVFGDAISNSVWLTSARLGRRAEAKSS